MSCASSGRSLVCVTIERFIRSHRCSHWIAYLWLAPTPPRGAKHRQGHLPISMVDAWGFLGGSPSHHIAGTEGCFPG